MNICKALRLGCNNPNLRLAIVGAGGKTTALFMIADCLIENNRVSESGKCKNAVIVSATSHLRKDQAEFADFHKIINKPIDISGLEDHLKGIILVTGPVEGDRTKGLDTSCINRLNGFCHQHELPLIIEADGSRQRSIKAPGRHEPPIPDFVTTVVLVAGLSVLNKTINEKYIHRPEIFASLSGMCIGEQISPSAIQRVLTHPQGGLKNIPDKARRLVLLNQAEAPELLSAAGKMSQYLLKSFDGVIIGSLIQKQMQTFELTAGILLAAGGSTRLGKPKQLLDYHGEPFLRKVAKTALAAGLDPVIVVTGANSDKVNDSIVDLPVQIIPNLEWADGQSTSVKTGLKALHQIGANKQSEVSEVGSAMFLLADQPQVPVSLIQALVDLHRIELSPIVAPLVNDRRANPVLFDRNTFPDLMALSGDVGGRAVFSKYRPAYLPWHDETLLLDVDTMEDYKKLLGRES